MARTEALLRMCMVTQELDKAHFTGWSEDELKAIEAKDAAAIGQILAERLYKAGIPVAEYHCIIHDKDARPVWSDTIQNYIIEPKLTHFHCVMRFHLCDQFKCGLLSAC